MGAGAPSAPPPGTRASRSKGKAQEIKGKIQQKVGKAKEKADPKPGVDDV